MRNSKYEEINTGEGVSQRACAGARVRKHFKVTYAHFVFCCPNQFHVFVVVVFATEVLLFRIQHSLVLLFFPPDVLGFVTGYYLNRQKMMVQSFYFFFSCFLFAPCFTSLLLCQSAASR